MTKLEHALQLAASGFHVFPLAPGSKLPLLKGWDWKAGATKDPATINSWWIDSPSANIGIYTGRFGDSPDVALQVLDVDNSNGKTGWKSLSELDMLYGPYPHTFTVATPRGGQHLYFVGFGCGNSVSKVGEALDVRSIGGYVVGPGSELDGLGAYIIERKIKPTVVPDWLDALMRAANKAPEDQKQAAIDEMDLPEAVDSAISYLNVTKPAIEGDGGDHLTYQTACWVRDYGITEETCLYLMVEYWNDRCDPPWEYVDLEKKVYNAYNHAKGAQGGTSAAADFEPIGPDYLPDPGWILLAQKAEKAAEAEEERRSHLDPRPYILGEDDEVERREWVAHGFLVSENVTLLAAAPGVGKSTFCILAAAAIVEGNGKILGLDIDEPKAVWIWNQEDDLKEMHRRLQATRRYHGVLASQKVAERLFLNSGTLDPLLIARKLRDGQMEPVDVEAIIASLTRLGIGVLIVDPFLETHGASENSNEEINQVAGFFRTIAQRAKCAVVIVHHTKKATGGDMSDARGASALSGVVRIQRHLRPMDKKDGKRYGLPEEEWGRYVKLTSDKSNFTLDLAGPSWYRRVSVVIQNLEEVGTLEPISLMPAADEKDLPILQDILTALADEEEMSFPAAVEALALLPIHGETKPAALKKQVQRAVKSVEGKEALGYAWEIVVLTGVAADKERRLIRAIPS